METSTENADVVSGKGPLTIRYQDDRTLGLAEFMDVYRRSTLGERRRMDRPDIFEGMLKNASLLISAWDGDKLVGLARTLTDFTCIAYLADLAVDIVYQRRGIGKRLIEETKRRLGEDCMIVLLAAPQANEYYGKLGFEANPRGWTLKGS